MSFNLKKAILERKGRVTAVESKDEGIERRIRERKLGSSLFVIYLMKNYDYSCRPNKKDFNLRVWSKIDQRYCLNIYTNDLDGALVYAFKQYKKMYCAVLDIRKATQKELKEKFNIRFLD